jgi:hypothetical protein
MVHVSSLLPVNGSGHLSLVATLSLTSLEQGYDVRASLGGPDIGDNNDVEGSSSHLDSGRVILAVVDMGMVDYFRMQV